MSKYVSLCGRTLHVEDSLYHIIIHQEGLSVHILRQQGTGNLKTLNGLCCVLFAVLGQLVNCFSLFSGRLIS